MFKFAHPAIHAHSADRLKRFEGGMDIITLVAISIIAAAMLAGLLAPGNLVPW